MLPSTLPRNYSEWPQLGLYTCLLVVTGSCSCNIGYTVRQQTVSYNNGPTCTAHYIGFNLICNSVWITYLLQTYKQDPVLYERIKLLKTTSIAMKWTNFWQSKLALIFQNIQYTYLYIFTSHYDGESHQTMTDINCWLYGQDTTVSYHLDADIQFRHPIYKQSVYSSALSRFCCSSNDNFLSYISTMYTQLLCGFSYLQFSPNWTFLLRIHWGVHRALKCVAKFLHLGDGRVYPVK